jgi:phospholipase/carboxylesterase
MLSEKLTLKHVAQPPGAPVAGKPPLLICLHGVGSDEQDLFSLVPRLDPRFYVLSLRGPYELSPGKFGWYELVFSPTGQQIDPQQVEASRAKLVKFIPEAIEHYDADPDFVFLFGFSQGAILGLTTLLTGPQSIQGVVAVAGRVLPGLFLSDTPLSGKLAESVDLAGKALFLAHGVHDDVLPVGLGRQAESVLSRAPLELTYREYEMGHEIAPRCLNEIDVWLRTQLGGTGQLPAMSEEED